VTWAQTPPMGREQNQLAGAMYQSTLDGRFIEVDPLFADMLGYRSARDMIENIKDIGAQLYAQPDVRLQLIEQLQEHGAICNFETQLLRKDGSPLWVSEYSRVLRAADGSVSRFQGAFADIDYYKSLVLEQAESNQQLAREMAGLRQAILGTGRRRIPVKDGTRVKFMETSKIAFIRADGDYVHVHTINGERTMTRDRISSVARRIDNTLFVRISKSALVNVNYIKEMRSRRRGDYEFIMDSGEQLASGPTYRETVKKLLEELR